MKNENWLDAITDKWWKKNPLRARCYDVDESTSGIIFENIGGVFILIGIGIITAFSALIYEYFYYKYLQEKFERLLNDKVKSMLHKKNFARSISVKP